MHVIGDFIIFLLCAAIAVPLSRRLGFGAVLGYLAAGVLVGPAVLGLIDDVEAKLHFGELGVVLLLFIIGLELQPARLWVLRRSIFGLGGGQVLVTAVLLAALALALGLTPKSSLIAGLVLSLSSTAFVLQLLAEKRQLPTQHGRAAFATLLFQDLAVIPLLAIIPMLGARDAPMADGRMLGEAAEALGVIVAFIVAGHYLLRPLLRLVIPWGAEVSTAVALLLVLGSAAVMEHIGLSMALGAFLAGVLVADSEYRHELEANIEPFKGLLLGIFFIAVGMSLDVAGLMRAPVLLIGLTLGLMLVKALTLIALGRLYGLAPAATRLYAASLAQGGEFAFVLLALGVRADSIAADLANVLKMAVTLSMVLTPVAFMATEALNRRLAPQVRKREFDDVDDEANPVVIAGFGRVGQIVARILHSRGIGFTALEASASQVDFVRRFGNRVYYGDPRRLDLLRAAGVDKARLFVLAIDDIEASVRVAELVRHSFPRLTVLARARNRHHAHLLMDLGVKVIYRETLASSLELTGRLLTELGDSPEHAQRTIQLFREHDERVLAQQHAIHHDQGRLEQSAREARAELRRLFESDPERL